MVLQSINPLPFLAYSVAVAFLYDEFIKDEGEQFRITDWAVVIVVVYLTRRIA